MLVLARKQNETIVIQNQIVIEVLKVQGKTVRLGIKAPKNVRIMRGELKPHEIVASEATSQKASGSMPGLPGKAQSFSGNEQGFPADYLAPGQTACAQRNQASNPGLSKYIKRHPAIESAGRQVTMNNVPVNGSVPISAAPARRWNQKDMELASDVTEFIVELPISALKIESN